MTSGKVIYKKMDLDKITTADIVQVADLVVCLAAELNLPFKVDVIHRKVADCIVNQVGELYCAYDGYLMIGMIGLVYNPEMWSDDICLTEISWYVLPEYRGRVGINLVKEVEKNSKCGMFRIGVGDDKLRQVLERMGYTLEKYIMKKKV